MRILMTTSSIQQIDALLKFSAQLINRSNETVTLLVTRALKRSEVLPSVTEVEAFVHQIAGCEAVQVLVRAGSAARNIAAAAQETQAELIILDANYPSGSGWRRSYCDIASDVLSKSNLPVLIVPGQGRRIHRILLCDSGAGNAPLLNRLTTQLAKVIAGEEEITVLHVMSQISAGPGVRGKQLRADAETLIAEHTPEGELLASDLQALQHPGLHPHPKVRHGMVVEEILDEARAGDYDLVIIGARRGERWQRLLLEDLARKIMGQIDRPLLVVP